MAVPIYPVIPNPPGIGSPDINESGALVVSSPPILNFLGGGVTVTDNGGTADITITGFGEGDVIAPNPPLVANSVVLGDGGVSVKTVANLTFNLGVGTLNAPFFNDVPLTNTGGGTLFLADDGVYKANATGTAWGDITGTLSDQTDLQSELDGKLSLSGGALTGAVSSTSTITAVSFNAVPLTDGGSGTNFLADDGTYKSVDHPVDNLQDGQVVVADGDADIKTTGTTVFNVSNAIITTQDLAQEKTLKVSASRNWEHIDVTGNPSFSCIVYNQDAFIAAGSNGLNVYRSVDEGATWATVAVPVNAPWLGATYNSETQRTVLAGFGNAVITSDNGGLTWVQQTTPVIAPTPNWQDATYANGRYVAVGGSGSVGDIIWSNTADDNDWNIATVPAIELLKSAAYGNGVWVAGGGNTGSALVMSDDNGENWTVQTVPSSSIQSITFGKGVFLLADGVGDVYTSRSGKSGTWVQVANFGSGDTGATYYALGQFIVAGGASGIRTSWDTITWTAQTTSPATANLTYIAASDDYFVVTSSSPFEDIYRSTTPTVAITDVFEADGEYDFSVIPVSGAGPSVVTYDPIEANLSVGGDVLTGATPYSSMMALGTDILDSFTTSALNINSIMIGKNIARGAGPYQEDVVIGVDAMASSVAHEGCNAIGYRALNAMTVGDHNTVNGWASGEVLGSGSFNTFMGASIGSVLTAGSGNTIVGDNSIPTSTDVSNCTIIGKTTSGNPLLTPTPTTDDWININATIFGDSLTQHVRLGGSQLSLLTTSAAFEISSTTGALLHVRLSTGQKNALTPAAGMEVYDTTLSELQYYNGSAWVTSGGGSDNSPVETVYVRIPSDFGSIVDIGGFDYHQLEAKNYVLLDDVTMVAGLAYPASGNVTLSSANKDSARFFWNGFSLSDVTRSAGTASVTVSNINFVNLVVSAYAGTSLFRSFDNTGATWLIKDCNMTDFLNVLFIDGADNVTIRNNICTGVIGFIFNVRNSIDTMISNNIGQGTDTNPFIFIRQAATEKCTIENNFYRNAFVTPGAFIHLDNTINAAAKVIISDNISGATVPFYDALGFDEVDARVSASNNPGSFNNITGALLHVRLSTAQKNALTPTAGMEVYDTTLNELQYYNGSAWVSVPPVFERVQHLDVSRTTDFDFNPLPQNIPADIPVDGGVYDTADVSLIDSTGLITFKTTGQYTIFVYVVYGRDSTTGQASLFCGFEKDGVFNASDIEFCTKIDPDDQWIKEGGSLRVNVTAINTTYKLQMWTDSAAANGGESSILLKAPVSTFQSQATPSLNYKIWKDSE